MAPAHDLSWFCSELAPSPAATPSSAAAAPQLQVCEEPPPPRSVVARLQVAASRPLPPLTATSHRLKQDRISGDWADRRDAATGLLR